MKITRHNYEEWFILYLDNELGSEDRREVELFVKDNPDLQSEFDFLLQSQLAADTTIVFPGKHQLLKTAGSGFINKDNYEAWLLSYIDNELTADEKNTVELFVEAHPAIKAELDLIQKTKLQPETIVFADKQTLYRREEKVRVIAISWRRIAIAASLILAVGTTAVVLFNSGNKPPLVINNGEKNTVPVQQKTSEGFDQQEPANNQVAASSNEIEKEITGKSTPVTTGEKTKGSTPYIEKIVTNDIKQENIAVTPKEQKKSNELPEPVYNPNIDNRVSQDNPIAMADIPAQEPLTISKETSPKTTVTPGATGALYTANTSPETFEPVDEHQPGKKNKLRGFFRKVTRTFEKNTNIRATDDEDRLLLGGLAIKL